MGVSKLGQQGAVTGHESASLVQQTTRGRRATRARAKIAELREPGRGVEREHEALDEQRLDAPQVAALERNLRMDKRESVEARSSTLNIHRIVHIHVCCSR